VDQQLRVGDDVELDPYPQTTNVDPDFPDMWCAALSHAISRFEGCRPLYETARSGGVGATANPEDQPLTPRPAQQKQKQAPGRPVSGASRTP